MTSIRAISAALGATLTLATAGGASGSAAAPGAAACCAIVELRQYTLHPGRFDAFVELFESEFLEPLDAAGMTVIGQFGDLDDPNRFVWMRGFADMPARAAALTAFYDGPVWKARRAAANANFTDTDNVLLLHPAPADAGVVPGPPRAPGAGGGSGGMIVLTVYALDARQAGDFPAFFAREVRPQLARAGIAVAGSFATEASANNFPRLPVREGEHVFVWLARFDDVPKGDAALAALAGSRSWREHVLPALRARWTAAPQVLRLAPTPRSRLRGT